MLIKLFNSFRARIIMPLIKRCFLKQVAEHGEDITFGEIDLMEMAGINNIHLGSHIYLGTHPVFLCTEAPIYIKDYVMFGPQVMIVTGNHRTDVIGEFMFNVSEKLPENDQPVKIERDVWVGARAIILKGAVIGEGSVIAAGAVVQGVVPPYSIYINRNKIIPRFSEEQLAIHQEKVAGK